MHNDEVFVVVTAALGPWLSVVAVQRFRRQDFACYRAPTFLRYEPGDTIVNELGRVIVSLAVHNFSQLSNVHPLALMDCQPAFHCVQVQDCPFEFRGRCLNVGDRNNGLTINNSQLFATSVVLQYIMLGVFQAVFFRWPSHPITEAVDH